MSKYFRLFTLFFAVVIFNAFKPSVVCASTLPWWPVQSVDTMKYSRDPSREMLTKPEFDQVIDTQVKNIAATGATHVAIATPYDDEFLPVLTRWVNAARKYHLGVWFRGNWSGWEGWFGYSGISRSEHLEKTRIFILNNKVLFRDGDIFTACPECENGGPGDPRQTGDITGFRKFMTDEYQITTAAFKKIGVRVSSNFDSMNADVAKVVMDRDTTTKLDGLVVIDHYALKPSDVADGVIAIASQSGGQVVLGEFGAPIPDIHGKMSESDQATWLSEVLGRLLLTPQLIGVNYWVNVGGSTALWDDNNRPKMAVSVLTNYFSLPTFSGRIENILGESVPGAVITYHGRTFTSGAGGTFSFPVLPGDNLVNIQAETYRPHGLLAVPRADSAVIILQKSREDLWFSVKKLIYRLTHSILNK